MPNYKPLRQFIGNEFINYELPPDAKVITLVLTATGTSVESMLDFTTNAIYQVPTGKKLVPCLFNLKAIQVANQVHSIYSHDTADTAGGTLKISALIHTLANVYLSIALDKSKTFPAGDYVNWNHVYSTNTYTLILIGYEVKV